MNQKALENCNDNCNAETKAIVFLVTVVATCLHAEDAKMCPIHALMLVGAFDKAEYGHGLMSVRDLVPLVQTPVKAPSHA